MATPITRDNIADIWEALGHTTTAATYRAIEKQFGDEMDVVGSVQLADDIDAVLSQVPDGSKQHRETHNGDRWKTCTACLADKIGEVLP